MWSDRLERNRPGCCVVITTSSRLPLIAKEDACAPVDEVSKISRPKPPAIFARRQECFHHLGLNEVSVKAVQLVQPEVVASEIKRSFRRVVRIPAQVAEILHQDKRSVGFLLSQGRILGHSPQ